MINLILLFDNSFSLYLYYEEKYVEIKTSLSGDKSALIDLYFEIKTELYNLLIAIGDNETSISI